MLRNKINNSWLISIILVCLSSLVQTYVLQTFVKSANLLSSGFSGLSILIHRILALYHINFPISLGLVLFNVPFAILCIKNVSFKFTVISTIQFMMTSFLLLICNFKPIFDDVILNCFIGGFVYGLSILIALGANGSTGGTDFIAMYVSNKIGKSIWSYVFCFNAFILIVFGFIAGFENAGYSIIFQFISTQTIERFYHRFDQVTLQITTYKPNEVAQKYIEKYRHGMTITKSYGAYSKKELFLCHSVVSSYEVSDMIKLIKEVDNKAIINVFKTMNFYGGFYREKI